MKPIPGHIHLTVGEWSVDWVGELTEVSVSSLGACALGLDYLMALLSAVASVAWPCLDSGSKIGFLTWLVKVVTVTD